MRLSNAKCVVTGGASGIGAATVRRFVEEGAEVCILDYDLPAAQALATELGESVFALELDVRLEPAVQAAAESGVRPLEARGRVGQQRRLRA
jgi:3-oxoacyl-[acyl-carrier protein] reductase